MKNIHTDRRIATWTLLCFSFMQGFIAVPQAHALPIATNQQETTQPTLSPEQVQQQTAATAPAQPDGSLVPQGPLSPATVEKAEVSTQDSLYFKEVKEGESIQAAIDQADEGDTIFIHAGTYHESITLYKGVNLKGEGDKTVITGDYKTLSNVITAKGGNTIEDLTITGGGAFNRISSAAVKVTGSNVVIRNNVILNNRNYGIDMTTALGGTVEGNRFENNTTAAIHQPRDGTVIRNNEFIKNGIGVNMVSGTKPVIEGNLFQEQTANSIYEYAAGKVPPTGYAVIKNNTFIANKQVTASALPPAVANQTNGNLILNTAARWVRTDQIAFSSPLKVRIFSDDTYEMIYEGQLYRLNANKKIQLADGTQLQLDVVGGKVNTITSFNSEGNQLSKTYYLESDIFKVMTDYVADRITVLKNGQAFGSSMKCRASSCEVVIEKTAGELTFVTHQILHGADGTPHPYLRKFGWSLTTGFRTRERYYRPDGLLMSIEYYDAVGQLEKKEWYTPTFTYPGNNDQERLYLVSFYNGFPSDRTKWTWQGFVYEDNGIEGLQQVITVGVNPGDATRPNGKVFVAAGTYACPANGACALVIKPGVDVIFAPGVQLPNNLVITREAPSALVDAAKKTFAVLGLTVTSGKAVMNSACATEGLDCTTTYEFYDAANKLIGTNKVSPGLDVWNLVNSDGSLSKLVLQNNGETIMVYNANGQLINIRGFVPHEAYTPMALSWNHTQFGSKVVHLSGYPAWRWPRDRDEIAASLDDGVASAKIMVGADGYGGFYLNFNSSEYDGYMVGINSHNKTLSISRLDNGLISGDATVSLGTLPNQYYDLRVVMEGGVFKVFVNNQLMIEKTEESFGTLDSFHAGKGVSLAASGNSDVFFDQVKISGVIP